MCSTGTFQFTWLKGYIYSSCYYHHKIGSIHRSHCYHMFLWLCAWFTFHIIFCYLLHIHSGKTGNLFSLSLCSSVYAKVQIFGYVLDTFLACTLYSHYHHCANLSEDIELIKCVSYIFCRVCKIKRILLAIHYTICGAVCFQFTHFPCDDWANIYALSYYHHQIGSMNYYPLFRVRSWNNSMRCMSFYILITLTNPTPKE